MVRTKASNAAPAATRKGGSPLTTSYSLYSLCAVYTAVAARAPRKTVASPRPAGGSPSGGGGRGRKGKSIAVGGNPAKLWPTPDWQKGIGVGGAAHTHSLSSLSLSLLVKGFLMGTGDQEEPGPSRESHTHQEEEMETAATGSSSEVGVAILDSSIAQLNSDDDDSN